MSHTRPYLSDVMRVLAVPVLVAPLLASPAHAQGAADPVSFDFGTPTSPVAAGWIGIDETNRYDARAGHGIEVVDDNQPISRHRTDGPGDPVDGDFVLATSWRFLVNLPDGVYDVTVRSGDVLAGTSTTRTTVRLEGVTAGTIESREAVNRATWTTSVTDGQLTIDIAGDGPGGYVNGIEVVPSDGTPIEHVATVFLAGDSTVQSYPDAYYPMMGWGQRIGEFFDDGVVVDNRAIGGRSSKSYVLEGHLDRLLQDVRPGDYLLVQFGHNDKPNTDSLCSANPAYCNRHTEPYEEFQEYLERYIDGARAKGATPVLVTPMGRRNFNDDGTFNNDFHDYAQAMRQLSVEHDVPLVDLNAASIAFYTRIGPPATEEVFLYADPGEYEAYPEGKSDNVHFQEYGAGWLARFVAEGIVAHDLPLADHVQLPGDPENLATSARVTASSSIEDDGWYRWNVVDGEDGSVPQAMGWASNDVLSALDETEWVQLDLDQQLPLTRVVLHPAEQGFPSDVAVELSTDGEQWTTVASRSGQTVASGPVELTFPATDAGHVRVTGTKLALDGAVRRMRLAEVEVYSDVISVRLTGPETLAAGGRGLYTASLRLPSGLQFPKDARFDLEAPDDWQVKRHRTTDTQAGWLVTAPSAGWSEPATLRAVVTWREGGAVRATDDEHAVVWAAPPPPPEPGQHWVSDLPFLAEVNGWGPVERDMSNGDKAAGDGGPIAIDGVVYEKGLGVHADSSVTFALDRCDGFTAVAGLDDLNGAGGSVGFLVEADGVPLWVHPLARAGDPGAVVEVDLTGVTELRLAVNALGHNGHDHANWGAARLHGCAS